MTKTRTSKKQPAVSKRERILWVVVVILVILQTLSIVFMARIYQQDTQTHVLYSGMSKRFTYSLIADTEEQRYKQPIIDVAANRVYIPEAQVYLPLNKTSRDIRYNYKEADISKSLTLTTPAAIGHQMESDSPSCDAAVTLVQDQTNYRQSADYSLADTLQSPVNGLRYIYKHNACKIYSAAYTDDIVEVAKQMQKY